MSTLNDRHGIFLFKKIHLSIAREYSFEVFGL